ncbi:pectinesterase inhibitor-like [Impatiens glandulifera]|uniref:pectinesterase inhibitor-like n=1 Tax=Impatiens glandulifera TaxID=253017 RepID=UPI001FB11A58|nr:pectinesterase inhibitor-like [Impatiens glandulifera]
MSSCSQLLVFLFAAYYVLIATSSPIGDPRVKSSTTLIQNVCSKTHNLNLCNDILNSDPRSAHADLKGLVQILIDKTYAKGNFALTVIASLYKNANNTETKDQLHLCVISYKSAMNNLNKANAALKSGNREIISDITSVIDGAESCDDVYDGPPVIPPKLEQANKNFEDIANIIFSILFSQLVNFCE